MNGQSNSPYAYVVVLGPNHIDYTGALVLAKTLIDTGCQYDRIVLVTTDVHPKSLYHLRTYYSYVYDVDPILWSYGNNSVDFTKLQVLTLTKYKKVALIDEGSFVFKRLDHIFELRTPACPVIGGREGSIITNPTASAVSDGLILLEPKEGAIAHIISQLETRLDLTDVKGFILDYYKGTSWTVLSTNFFFDIGVAKMSPDGIPDTIGIAKFPKSCRPWIIFKSDSDISTKQRVNLKNKYLYYKLWTCAYNDIKLKFSQQDPPVQLLY